VSTPPATWPMPRWVAHRGAGKLAPENTLAAFRLGAGHGYRAFECDVKLSADGVPFLLHDTTLERTTPEGGTAGERPWAELSRLDAGGWHSRAYAGEPLPSLAAIATYVQRNGFALNLEIKPTPGQEQATGRAIGAWCAARWPAAGSPLLFSSFRPEALQGALEAAPALPRALLLDTLWDGWEAVARDLGCIGVVTHHRLFDAALVSHLQALGLHGAVYTVNDAAEAARLLGLGVASIITDAVDLLAPAV
jgi:glycerophosphoryl diester phosphodiesterase